MARSILTMRFTRPGRYVITTMRSESWIASVMLCVISSVVCFSCCWICSTLSPSSMRVCSSSDAKGSSISRILGWKASVRAIDTRCRMPPDSSAG